MIVKIFSTRFALVTLMCVNFTYAQDVAKAFQQQIETSCRNGLSLDKTVRDGSTAETKHFVFGQNCVCRNQPDFDLKVELEYATKYRYSAPKIVEYFQVTKNGATVTATLGLSDAHRSPLKKQVIEWSADGKRLRRVVSHIQRSTWLYESDLQIDVRFDATGVYLSHELRYNNRVSFSGSGMTGVITGVGNYAVK